jgi:hypothetical protein
MGIFDSFFSSSVKNSNNASNIIGNNNNEKLNSNNDSQLTNETNNTIDENIVGMDSLNSSFKYDDKSFLKVCSWNVEDFTKVSNYNYENLAKNDLILIQEWKGGEYQNMFMYKLNANKDANKPVFNFVNIDRVALVYNTILYRPILTLDIPLVYEAPTPAERVYTTGRQKSNMVVVLSPTDPNKYSYLPTLAVIVVHLSAYHPLNHPTIHSKQFTLLLRDSLKELEKNNIELNNIKIIMGGDTNYRQPLNQANNLYTNLLNPTKNFDCVVGKGEGNNLCELLTPQDKDQINNLGLKDVCENGESVIGENGKKIYKTCSLPTQSFKCIHETGVSKGLASLVGKTGSIADSRLDILITNLTARNTQIIPMCNLSDHNAITTELLIDNTIGGKRKRKSIKRKSIKRKSIKRKSIKRKSIKRKYIRKRKY